MLKSDVSLIIHKDDWKKWFQDSKAKYNAGILPADVYHFCFHFDFGKITFGDEYIKMDWLDVYWNKINEAVKYILGLLTEIKHYDLIRITGDKVFKDLHTGKNLLKIKKYIIWED